MQTVTIHTTQNIGIDYEVAGLGDRILARLIDYGLFFVLWIATVFVIASANVSAPNLDTILLITLAAVFGFYDLVCEIFFNGQSIGKRIMKIRVMSLDGARPTISQYLIRWVFRIVDFGITLQLGGLISGLLTKNVQRIGDVVAGTTLIRTKPRTQMDHLVFKPSADDYVPVFNEVMQLSDKDIALVNEVIVNYLKTANTVVIYNMANRIKDHLGITTPPEMNDYVFLQTILKDYTHMAAQAVV
ncbi:RDD family protein [Mucilaginibacter limnophilus]|uniref:RDD family protein n=1 Tax=Mucilaginibacter limnophilus TaxID=1932778 RepID=A0A437MW83_9SPHI|nr:RDD family protein [Mucilaginibacter limnophilus]RVU01924.1 RDD family protein [Mucilaginibacter limnophilus]